VGALVCAWKAPMMKKHEPTDTRQKKRWKAMCAQVMQTVPPTWLHIAKSLNACEAATLQLRPGELTDR
jgi:hypothetical protein